MTDWASPPPLGTISAKTKPSHQLHMASKFLLTFYTNKNVKHTCHLKFIRHFSGQFLICNVIQGARDDNRPFKVGWNNQKKKKKASWDWNNYSIMCWSFHQIHLNPMFENGSWYYATGFHLKSKIMSISICSIYSPSLSTTFSYAGNLPWMVSWRRSSRVLRTGFLAPRSPRSFQNSALGAEAWRSAIWILWVCSTIARLSALINTHMHEHNIVIRFYCTNHNGAYYKPGLTGSQDLVLS